MFDAARLTIAYTPDSDDAFYYYALKTGHVRLPGYLPEFVCEPLSVLNVAAQSGIFDITAISSAVYPLIADQYAILSVGSSVGRGYGPVLVSKNIERIEELRGRRVGVGGVPTTGWFLLRWLCPEAVAVTMPFDCIGEAVARGEIDAGVMIHEELLYYPKLGLRRVMDLGAEWCERTGLPLPVGLNVARRDLGRPALERICQALRSSLQYGLANRERALDWVSRYGRGKEGQCTRQFVEMFANSDSMSLPQDVRDGLQLLLKGVVELGVGASVPALDIVEGIDRPTAAKRALS